MALLWTADVLAKPWKKVCASSFLLTKIYEILPWQYGKPIPALIILKYYYEDEIRYTI